MLPNEVIVNSMTLKVERENAKAMIEGFTKGDVRHFVTIFVANGESSWSMRGNFRKNPKLITPIKHKREYFYPSEIGRDLRADSYQFKINRVAILDRIFHIKNDIRVWETLCSNGVFDIWQPTAPDKRLNIGKQGDAMILALRICEVDHDFTDEIIDEAYFHSVPQRVVKIGRPMILDADFGAICEKIGSSIKPFIIGSVESVFDSTEGS